MKTKNKPLKWIVMILISLILISCDSEMTDETSVTSYSFLVGTYTESPEEGIGLLIFDPVNETLTHQVVAPGVQNPSFLLADKNKKIVYAVEETTGERGGNIRSFRWADTGTALLPVQSSKTFGDHPCYIGLSLEEDFVVVGNYSGGNFSVYALENAGKFTHVQTFQHEGQSINHSRQEQAHVHSTVFHPNGKQLLVGDLGTDKIHLYDFHPDYAVPFAPAQPPHLEVQAGAGPRHLAVHPEGHRVYLVHELSAVLGVYSYEEGIMKEVQTLPLTAPDFIGNVGAAEVRISPDNEFVYVSNRGDANELAVFRINKAGNLDLVERVSSGGETPRNFNFTPDGEYLLVAHQTSNDVVVFKRDLKTGKLSATGMKVSIPKPVYLYSLD
jgi:6-phosphogluconolactonase